MSASTLQPLEEAVLLPLYGGVPWLCPRSPACAPPACPGSQQSPGLPSKALLCSRSSHGSLVPCQPPPLQMKGGENKLDGEDWTHAWEHSVQYAQRQNQNNPNPCPPPPAATGSKDPRV